MRWVGDLQEEGLDPLFVLARRLLNLLDLGLDAVRLLEERLRLVLPSGLHERADLAAQLALLLLERLERRERGAALAVGVEEAVHEGRVGAFGGDGGLDALGVVAEELEVEHAQEERRGDR